MIQNPCRLLTRGLLYTALTRQREHVVLFHQGDLRALLKLSLAQHSETARRLTNLFADPRPVEHIGAFLEEGLIHRTTRGELVRSKSEVIIANLLHALGITYAYEQPFAGRDGSVRYPDFTIEDAETGRRVFLEHLGLMSEPAYRRRWLAKIVGRLLYCLRVERHLSRDELRKDWRRLYRMQPPRLSRDLLVRAIAYRIQELRCGGLSKATSRKLAALVEGRRSDGETAPEGAQRIRAGARLVREWNGRTHTVTVEEEGFTYAGRDYRSLSAIAREITGARWSGPRFFGLAPKRGASDA